MPRLLLAKGVVRVLSMFVASKVNGYEHAIIYGRALIGYELKFWQSMTVAVYGSMLTGCCLYRGDDELWQYKHKRP